jgi:hypothetical protein
MGAFHPDSSQFVLHQFNLAITPRVFVSFLKRMKEVGFVCASSFNDTVYYFGEKDSVNEYERFLQVCLDPMTGFYTFQDGFYDNNADSKVYNIVEAMCEAFEGTFVGDYHSTSGNWSVEIKNGIRNPKLGTTHKVSSYSVPKKSPHKQKGV